MAGSKDHILKTTGLADSAIRTQGSDLFFLPDPRLHLFIFAFKKIFSFLSLLAFVGFQFWTRD